MLDTIPSEHKNQFALSLFAIRTEKAAFEEAQHALEIRSLFPKIESVRKVSFQIVQYISKNYSEIIQLLSSDKNDRFLHELLDPSRFGRISELAELLKEPLHTESNLQLLIEKVRYLLSHPERSSLEQTLQIHAAFGWYIFRVLDHQFEPLVRELGTKPQGDGRIKPIASQKPHQSSLHGYVGFNKSRYYQKKLGKLDQVWEHGHEVHTVDLNSSYVQSLSQETPYAAGPSNHTASLMALACRIGQLEKHELQEYSKSVFSFLATGGHHTEMEVSLVAEKSFSKIEPTLNYSAVFWKEASGSAMGLNASSIYTTLET